MNQEGIAHELLLFSLGGIASHLLSLGRPCFGLTNIDRRPWHRLVTPTGWCLKSLAKAEPLIRKWQIYIYIYYIIYILYILYIYYIYIYYIYIDLVCIGNLQPVGLPPRSQRETWSRGTQWVRGTQWCPAQRIGCFQKWRISWYKLQEIKWNSWKHPPKDTKCVFIFLHHQWTHRRSGRCLTFLCVGPVVLGKPHAPRRPWYPISGPPWRRSSRYLVAV